MTDGSEAVWRKALRAKGKEWVMAELQRRPGQPGDPVYDIVFEEPYPTRDFCQRWCGEEDNRLFRFSWETTAALVFVILTLLCGVGAVKSWNASQPVEPSPAAAMAAVPQAFPLTRPDTITNDVPNQTASNPGSAQSVSHNLPSLCSYQTYETAECKTQR